MNALTLAALRLRAELAHRARDERGDVPGWVLVTVMSAGLVGALWTLAGDELETLLTEALRNVQG